MLIKAITKNFELLFWIAAILALAATNPALHGHFSLCIFKLAGISWCPGCGIGHAISWLLHGHVTNSLKAHWLGIPALAVIIHRIYCLIRRQMITFRQLKHLKHHAI